MATFGIEFVPNETVPTIINYCKFAEESMD